MTLVKAATTFSPSINNEQLPTDTGGTFVRQKPRNRKKTWGIFYTPVEVTRCLAEWAITHSDDNVLEPSFGGCNFLKESVRALDKKGSRDPWKQLCGCDKDLAAFVHLPSAYARPSRGRRFLHKNFLDTSPADFCHQDFNVVIGNPPYVSRHNMRKYQLESVDKINRFMAGKLPRRSSLWAYFLIHSLRFLKTGGRMGWVLPRSLSQSNYGRKILELLCKRFTSVTVISVERRLFLESGAEELIDVLLCAGYFATETANAISPYITYANSVEELKAKLIERTDSSCPISVEVSSGRQELLSSNERSAISLFETAIETKCLGDIARIKIGIVIGATRFFVLRRSELENAKLTEAMCTPLLTKTAYVKGIAWQDADVKASIASDHRMLLVRSDLAPTKTYWDRFPAESRDSIKTFKKRKQWNAPDDGQIPRAFFFGLVDNGPRLVLNQASINANNSVYRVLFKDASTEQELQALAVLTLSSYVQLSGELVGRLCGSGGLKFEPSDAYRLKIIDPRISSWAAESWPKIDLLMRNGEMEATRAVDALILQRLRTRLSSSTIATIQSALQKLRRARKRPSVV